MYTSMYSFPGVLLYKRASQWVCISQEAASTGVNSDTPACSLWLLCTPEGCTSRLCTTNPTEEAKHRGKRWTWRTLHSCAAKPGGKHPLCHSPGSQLLFFQERRKGVIFPMQLEKLMEDNRQAALTVGEATCLRQDVEMNTPGRCLIPCSFSPSSEQTLGKSIKEGPYDNYTTSE